MAVNTTFTDGSSTIFSTWLNWVNQVVNGILGIGYLLSGAGLGGSITQGGGKTFGVTLNTYCGAITTANSALASGAIVFFTVTNSKMGSNDVVLVSGGNSAGTPGAYQVWAEQAAGGFRVFLKNNSGGSLSEPVTINFSIVKGVLT